MSKMKTKKKIESYKLVEFLLLLFISFFAFTMEFSFIIILYILFLFDWIVCDLKYIKKIIKGYKSLFDIE